MPLFQSLDSNFVTLQGRRTSLGSALALAIAFRAFGAQEPSPSSTQISCTNPNSRMINGKWNRP